MKAHHHLFTLAIVFLPVLIHAQVSFIENKGQWDQQVLFRSENGNSSFFLGKDGYTVLMRHATDYRLFAEYYHGHHQQTGAGGQGRTVPPAVRAHAYKVKFLESNLNAQIVQEKTLAGYTNFFIGNDSSKWAAGCKSYEAITYKNLYNGIDLVYYVQNGELKYDLVVNPGADLSQIQLHYDGVTSLRIKNRELVVGTSVGDAQELQPYTYQYSNGRKEIIQCSYKLEGNTVSFDVSNYDNEKTLIIDPILIFSSYSRSATDNWGMSAAYGPDGSFFGAGIALSTGFPVSTGVIQTTGGGPSATGTPGDIGIIKLSADGTTRMYATYLGGTGMEQPQSMIADAAGNLIVTGRTNSGASFPGNLAGPGGSYDIFVTKINADGTAIIGSTKIGGTNDDGVNISSNRGAGPQALLRNYGDDARSEVILDANNNILLAGSTNSSNFPVSNGFQNTFGGSQDAVIIKLNPDANAIIWSTYLGGIGFDGAFGVAVNAANGIIYIAGGTTTSVLFPGISQSSLQQSFSGGAADGFITRLHDNGTHVSMFNSTYLGTSGVDIIYGIKLDQSGSAYVTGTSTGFWPVLNAVYSVVNARQFIAKLFPDCSGFVYSTTFGTAGAASPNISPVAFTVDDCGNVYVAGWGGGANSFGGGPNTYPTAGTTGLPVTPDAFQSTTDGSDFYMFVLQKDAASQLYGGFFGQLGGNGGLDHVEGGTSRFDSQGVLYLAACANCKNVGAVTPAQTSFPITAGVFGDINPSVGGGGCNLGMVKLKFDFAGSGCVITSDNSVRIDTAAKLSFFPNPNKGRFQIRYHHPSNTATQCYLRVFNEQGIVVFKQPFTANRSYNGIVVDMGAKAAGVYFVEVSNAKGIRMAAGKFFIE